ncbi:MAG: aminoglycoside phosphotransferase family protein [Pseudomonadota bacterium]
MDTALHRWAEDRARTLDRAPAPDRASHWQALPVEASHRRFYRLAFSGSGGRRSFVAMASPPELENNDQFVALAELFADHAIGVPRILAADREAGFFLLTDLGRRHFSDAYRDGGTDAAVSGALETLIRLQRIDDPRIPPYTRQRLVDELAVYEQWFLQGLLGVPAPDEVHEAFATLVAAACHQPACCVHRDFHARNLLLTAEGGVGVVDFQDALMGPATYDLASLLRDCYHTFPETEVARWRDAYLDRTELDLDRARFAHDLDLTALQRQLKAVGIFARLHLRDGRDSHLPHIVPVLTRIAEVAGAYPRLAPLARHVSVMLPLARRRLETNP